MTTSQSTYLPTTRYYRMGHAQQGAALIVVLLFLVLIMLAGVIAVRQSTTDLKTATADQINTLLLQSAESGNQKLESMVNGSSSSTEYKDITSIDGALGHFLLNKDNDSHEFVYCFNPREKKYLALNATIRKDGGYWSGLNNGVCDYTKADSYISARQTAMAQMHVSITPRDAKAESFSHVVLGKETENRTSQKFKFDIRAASALPAYAEPEDGSDKCFEKTSIAKALDATKPEDKTTPLLTCLHNATTPSKVLYQQADVENMSSSTECIPFGKASTLAAECTLL